MFVCQAINGEHLNFRIKNRQLCKHIYIEIQQRCQQIYFFRQELSGVFTFYSPQFTDRARRRTEMVRNPPVLEPMARKKV